MTESTFCLELTLAVSIGFHSGPFPCLGVTVESGQVIRNEHSGR